MLLILDDGFAPHNFDTAVLERDKRIKTICESDFSSQISNNSNINS